MNRGDIYWAELAPRSGSEQKGIRPVIILSHNVFNQTPRWKSVIVVPVSTSTLQARRSPTIVILPRGTSGLTKESFAICHQITTIDRAKLQQYIGTLEQNYLKQVEQGIKNAIDLSS